MSYFGVTFSVADFYTKETVDNFVRYCTTKSDRPGMFFTTDAIGTSVILNEHRLKTYLVSDGLSADVLYGPRST